MDARSSSLEEQARAVERTIPSRSASSATLGATIKSAELYLQALRLADRPADRDRLDTKVKNLLAHAERLKAARDGKPPSITHKPLTAQLQAPSTTRKLTTRENIILLEGSKLNGFVFKPWASAPTPDEFTLQDGASPFADSPPLPLSSSQLESFDGWKRPDQALSCLVTNESGQALPTEAVMHLAEPMDLVQDMTSDCSVVASLCALTSRAERGFPKILRSTLYPYDYASDRMIPSQNGKYVLKLYFNGCWRRVEIDDQLPSSKTGRVLHVIDRRHPGLLWPALVEKAYLKVRGGYDFPGSNSGTDLAVLTGWIPQQVFLHDEDVEPDLLWDEIVSSFERGHLLVTIGTGKLPRREQRHLGLAAEHDYAILDLSSKGETREMLVKNPWADGDVWRGASRRRPNRTDEAASDSPAENEEMMPGTFWMDFGRVFQYFENMYLNWQPGLFAHRQDMHFSWEHRTTSSAVGNLFVDAPQFAIAASDAGEIWLLLHRHFRTGDYTQATVGKNGYISLYLYARDGDRVISSEGAKLRGPFVDSPNTLLRFQAAARTRYTAVLVSQDLPAGKMNFTISAFARSSVSLSEARLQYAHKSSLRSAWTRSTAGGNSDSADYLSNPQFGISVASAQRVALVLRVLDPGKDRDRDDNGLPAQAGRDAGFNLTDINVKMVVVYHSGDGSRITRLRGRDVLAHSGDYRRGSAVVETELGKGRYTVICSTFDQGQFADFVLDLHTSSASSSLVQLAAEGSGRLAIKSSPAIFHSGTTRLLAPLTVRRMSRVAFVLRQDGGSGAVAQSSLYKMTLEQGQGPYKTVLASSEVDDEEFGSVSAGLRIGDVDLRPEMAGPGTGGLWVVLERLARGHGEDEGRDGREELDAVRVDMFSDERVELEAWGQGDG